VEPLYESYKKTDIGPLIAAIKAVN
jgi:hypothetical protein